MSESLLFEQPELDEQLSRSLDPKTQKEVKTAWRAYGVPAFVNGRWATVCATIQGDKVTKLTVYGHMEIEKEFAEEHMMRTLHQLERMKR